MDGSTVTGRYLRTVIVGDNPEFVRATWEWIESEPGIILVATAESGSASLSVVDVLRPDLVLIDVAMTPMDGIEVTRRVKARPEPPAVVLMTQHDPADIAFAAREAGADAVISQREFGQSAECILRALGAQLLSR
jgi:CheY-like chemotaxis protein